MGDDQLRVILADDHPLVRAGIRATLSTIPDINVVAEAEDGDTVLQQCGEYNPDILLLDLSMPGPSPLEIIAELKERCPDVRVLVVTAYDSDAYVRGLMAAGAAGYILKDEDPEVVVDAIRTVNKGGTWFSRQVLDKLIAAPDAGVVASPFPHLTKREREILEMIADGWDNARIATELHLAEQTIRNYTSRIYDKLNVNSRGEAIVWAREHGFALD